MSYGIAHQRESRKPENIFRDLLRLTAVISARERADKNVLKHGEPAERFHYLKGAADSRECDLVQLLAGDVATLKQHAALSRLVEPGYQVEDRGFPRAIRAYDADSFTLTHGEAERIHRSDSAKAFCQVFDFQKRQWHPRSDACCVIRET